MPSRLHDKIDGVKYATAERTFRRYGLSDLFREHPDIAPAGPGVYDKLVTFGKHIGDAGRDLIFGSPVSMAKKLEQNYQQTKSAPKALGKYVKDWYLDPSTPAWVRALSVGVPLYGIGSSLLSSDREHMGENVAGSLVGLATSPLTSRLGPVGQDMNLGAQRAAMRGTHALSHQPQRKGALTEGAPDVTE